MQVIVDRIEQEHWALFVFDLPANSAAIFIQANIKALTPPAPACNQN